MIIKNIEVIPFSIPYKKTVSWLAGSLSAADHLILKVEAEDGTYGVTEAIPRPMIYGETQESIYCIVKKHIAPLLIGEDSFALERIWEK